MERKRLLVACGIITLLAVIGIIVVLAVLGNRETASSTAPKPLTVRGNLTCLPHKNVQPGQPVTLECAIGLKTADGRHYGLRELSPRDTNTDFTKQVQVSGNVVPPTADERYDIIGTITVESFQPN
jgi:hypothetical protein